MALLLPRVRQAAAAAALALCLPASARAADDRTSNQPMKLGIPGMPRHADGAADRRAVELNNLAVRAAQEGRFDAAADQLRESLALNPNDATARRNFSSILTDWAAAVGRDGQVDKAVRLLLEAVDYQPENGQAYALLGNFAYFQRGDFTEAIGYWKRAAGYLTGPERRVLADRIAQAQRDQSIERTHASAQTEHFDVRLQAQSGLPLKVLAPVLELAYERVRSELGEGPARVSVIVYTEQDLRRTYNNRDWAIGFYDGRLRLRADEIGTDWGQALVAHELTHAFLHQRYGDRVPVWLHEGLAQMEEGERPMAEEERLALERLQGGADWVPLKWLDRRFTHPASRDDVIRAYVQARITAQALIRKHGWPAMQAFLQRLSAGDAVEAAYEAAFSPARWAQTDRPLQ